MVKASVDTKNNFIKAVICSVLVKTWKENMFDEFKMSVISDCILVRLDYTENILQNLKIDIFF